jgi:hypothetical protein
MEGFGRLGNPSIPADVAARGGYAQPNSQPLGSDTGAPPQTSLKTVNVPPQGQYATAVPPTRENRFVTFVAPSVGFTIYIGMTEGVTATNGMPLPPGTPYEVSLPGMQAIYVSSNAPVHLQVTVQIAAALAGDLERKLRR